MFIGFIEANIVQQCLHPYETLLICEECNSAFQFYGETEKKITKTKTKNQEKRFRFASILKWI